ncbi:hypothetical protein JQ596_19245 [Bradyrhizobium manausense]|uniref:hypothetical protein n=1 Tax=Bradyrhizobium TaxID=374 RepID=UPI001BAA637E|nr:MULTISPECIES: hypothetical protein [Bradyrhizobium]MBR0827667.1 hypothetical protein [Bradyrhizobium manausense]UVO26144.1 hypothetical protein KUF59_26705 [Bradyrhizobium arachidis]
MGRSDRFFRRVWRFNAIAIATVAVLLVLSVFFAAATIVYDHMRARRVTNVGERDAVANRFLLLPPRVITGTPYVEALLHRGQSYGDGSDVNVLFVNILTNESRWLFEGTGQQILGSHWMFDRVAEARTAVGAFHIVGDRDTNVALVAVAADGTNSRKLIEGIEKVYSVKQVADDKALVLYLKDKQAMSALFSLPSMALLTQAKLPDWGRATGSPARTD